MNKKKIMRKLIRESEKAVTNTDNSNRFGQRVVPNKKHKVEKFDYTKEEEI